jgi:hypothetical protein
VFRTYLASAFLALGLYGYAQLRGWSLFPSEAQAYQSARAAEAESRGYGGGGGRSGGFSGK